MKRIALLVALVAMSTLPALAQTDVLSGMWRPLARNEDGSGLDGDYAGLPMSPAGRLRAQSWPRYACWMRVSPACPVHRARGRRPCYLRSTAALTLPPWKS